MEGPEAWNLAHHEDFINDNLVVAIRDALKEYGESKGYNHEDIFYENLAWAGLESTGVYNSQLTPARRQEIADQIEAERTSSTFGDFEPKGTRVCD